MANVNSEVSVVAEHVWMLHHQVDFQSVSILAHTCIYISACRWSPGLSGNIPQLGDLHVYIFVMWHCTYRNVIHASNFACTLSCLPTMRSIQLDI